MERNPVYSTDELRKMLYSEDLDQQGTAGRRIWTDWGLYNNKDELLKLENKLLDLLMETNNERNIWHFMICLGLMNSFEAIKLIFENLIHSQDENIRGFAADAFSRYSEDVLPAEVYQELWVLAKEDQSLVVRVNSIRAISNQYIGTKNDKISMKLWDLLKIQSHSAIKTTILQQIGEIGSLAIVPNLIHALITRRTEIDKKLAGIALDKIAEVNGYHNREKLIKIVNEQKDL